MSATQKQKDKEKKGIEKCRVDLRGMESVREGVRKLTFELGDDNWFMRMSNVNEV